MARHILNHFEKYLSMLFTIIMVFALVCQVLTRHVFKLPMPWTEEVALITFILSVYTGACNAVTTRQHIKLAIIQEKVSLKVCLIMRVLSNILFAVTVSVLSYGMYFVIFNLKLYKSFYISTGIPKYMVYSVILAMFLLMVIRLVQDTVRLIKEYGSARDIGNGEVL